MTPPQSQMETDKEQIMVISPSEQLSRNDDDNDDVDDDDGDDDADDACADDGGGGSGEYDDDYDDYDDGDEENDEKNYDDDAFSVSVSWSPVQWSTSSWPALAISNPILTSTSESLSTDDNSCT